METLKNDELIALKGGKNEVTGSTLTGATIIYKEKKGKETTKTDKADPEDDIVE